MKNFPLISICIPTYNGEKYILQALESAVTQTYPNIEVVISDDDSKDDTLQLINDFTNSNKIPVKLFHHKPSGIGANWNNCIKQAQGKYIKFLFQDDILYESCVEELVNVLTTNDNVGLVACKRSILVEGKTTSETETWKKKFGNLQEGMKRNEKGYYVLDSKQLKNEKFIKNNKVGEPSTVMFPRALFKKVGPFREDLIQVLDLEYYYRILKHRKILIVDQELAGFRIHPGQATNVNKESISGDYEKYYRILYRDFFWFLGFDIQKKLFKKYHPIGKLYSYLRS